MTINQWVEYFEQHDLFEVNEIINALKTLSKYETISSVFNLDQLQMLAEINLLNR